MRAAVAAAGRSAPGLDHAARLAAGNADRARYLRRPVITEISKTFRFESAHRLPHVPADHKCGRVHGHSYAVTVRVRGEVDPHTGWIVDFAELSAAWQPLHALLDHRLLNDVAGLENPTSENLARFVAERFVVPAPARLHSVTVAETCTSECTVWPA